LISFESAAKLYFKSWKIIYNFPALMIVGQNKSREDNFIKLILST